MVNGLERMEQRASQRITGQMEVAPIEVDGVALNQRPIDGALLQGGRLEQWSRRLRDEQLPLSALPKKKRSEPIAEKPKDPYATETHWGEVIFRG